ncbi:MAG: protein kinase [Selenomonas sp.]|nr:protein kinase [Selenomonas sp.]
MARKVNYDEKISALEAKIAKKQDEVKALRAEVKELKEKKAKEDYQELTDYMLANNLSAKDILDYIKA